VWLGYNVVTFVFFHFQFREDITALNRKHREEAKRLEQAVNEAKVSGAFQKFQ